MRGLLVESLQQNQGRRCSDNDGDRNALPRVAAKISGSPVTLTFDSESSPYPVDAARGSKSLAVQFVGSDDEHEARSSRMELSGIEDRAVFDAWEVYDGEPIQWCERNMMPKHGHIGPICDVSAVEPDASIAVTTNYDEKNILHRFKTNLKPKNTFEAVHEKVWTKERPVSHVCETTCAFIDKGTCSSHEEPCATAHNGPITARDRRLSGQMPLFDFYITKRTQTKLEHLARRGKIKTTPEVSDDDGSRNIRDTLGSHFNATIRTICGRMVDLLYIPCRSFQLCGETVFFCGDEHPKHPHHGILPQSSILLHDNVTPFQSFMTSSICSDTPSSMPKVECSRGKRGSDRSLQGVLISSWFDLIVVSRSKAVFQQLMKFGEQFCRWRNHMRFNKEKASSVRLDFEMLVMIILLVVLLAPVPVLGQQCTPALRTGQDKDLYRVGVLAIRGFPAAYEEFNSTFTDYLTATAGARFDPPIRFELKPLNFILLFTDTEAGNVDFIYVNPSAYSCIESEYGAHSLASQISRRKVGGNVYHLTKFGGVIFTRAESDVETVEDVRGKSVACASISGLGSGQMQFRLLQQAGLSYINDPKQMVFTSNQGKVVNGVLHGEFDVGYVRTDQIERTKDTTTGVLVNASELKIIEPQEGLNIDGDPFPFESSTPLYPEWNIAALTHVPNDVAIEVQQAMLALADHAAVGENITACYDASNCTGAPLGGGACESLCEAAAPLTERRCDTTIPLALLAHTAKIKGKFAGWRSTLSYMELRNMQEETAFIGKNPETGAMQCIRSSAIYDAIVCPPGHFKKNEEDVLNGCEDAGLTCGEGFQCVCSPCVKAYDVDVFSASGKNVGAGVGCPKMALCGSVEQTKTITFRAVDNKKRSGLVMSVQVHEGDTTREVAVRQPDNNTHIYEFDIDARKVGVAIFEVFADDEQIPESPQRLEVRHRSCAEEMDDALREPDGDGQCVCVATSVDIGGRCVSFAILLPAVLVPIVLVWLVVAYIYIERKRKLADSVWAVKTSELQFEDPPIIVGRGTFGLVLLAEYRGTQVAVKRVIPPRVKADKETNGVARRNSFLGTGDMMGSSSGSGVYVKSGERISPDALFDYKDEEGQKKNGEAGDSTLQRIQGPQHVSREQAATGDNFTLNGMKSGSFALRSGSGAIRSGGSVQSKERSKTWTLWDKHVRRRDEYSRLKADFIVEMRHLSKLRHPCITTVMGAVIAAREEPMLVMEYMDHGSLYDLLHNETMVIEGELLLPILRDIAQGVRFLHAASPQVIHGDLKAQNVLVDNKFRAKVADFGLSQKKQVGATGTPLWMAPELLRGESENTAASDIYSFGIILYEVYSRKDPYEGEDHQEVLRLVCDRAVNKRPQVPDSMPQSVASLMSDCVTALPASRPTSEELDVRLRRFDVENVEPGRNYYSMQSKKARREAERSHHLLSEVFPPHIAEALKAGRKVEPEYRECCTIFFSDIVGFTTISSEIHPMKVSDMLDRLYMRFDALSEHHGVFKIETIGDAWMGVTNLTMDQPDHTKRIAEFSIDAMKASNETLIDPDDPSLGYVQIRVGFHSGPVLANVVGTRSPKYTIFGDTVNTSSRMESNSLPGRIQCSDRSAMLLMRQAPGLTLVCRGLIKVKGKGEMCTYWVGLDSGLSSSDSDDEAEVKPKTFKYNNGFNGVAKNEFNEVFPEDEGPPPPRPPRRGSMQQRRGSFLEGVATLDVVAEASSENGDERGGEDWRVDE